MPSSVNSLVPGPEHVEGEDERVVLFVARVLGIHEGLDHRDESRRHLCAPIRRLQNRRDGQSLVMRKLVHQRVEFHDHA
jgi:hypothetical protein